MTKHTMNRDDIMKAAEKMANAGNGIMKAFYINLTTMRDNAPERYENLMTVMEKKKFRNEDELRAYVCE